MKEKPRIQFRATKEDEKRLFELMQHMQDYSFKEVTKSDILRFAVKRLHEELIQNSRRNENHNYI
ncbi:hypothetical protein [Bacillus sp. 37MA]|uniref:hypothetical protein n=1 Tax=Bacillus sp. 37MA TaxID=1132442 RepID=UPI0003638272|nr:hypothetical protein [Bacillus sp. 37MA]